MKHVDFCKQFLSSNSIILDVGAGRGKFLREMAKLGFKVFGVEVNPDYIKEAGSLAEAEKLIVEIIQGKAESLPFPDNYFDFVNCAEVTEHVENLMQVCKEIFRVLKTSSYAYISFHNRWGIFDYHYHLWFINWLPRSWAEVVLGWLGKSKPNGVAGRQKLASMHYYRYGQVCRMLGKIGFTVRDTRVEKIRSRYGLVAPFFLLAYKTILRPFYFNTFHVLLQK